MNGETIDAVTEWETVAVEKGYRGLHDLADAGFTGAVTDGLAWAFVLNGRVVGVFEGALASFEGADLTAHRAPDPALPLLYAMRERGGETRAKYYTQEMSLSEADETLRSGGFTGYVRLSENVLSGDYFVVYYGGKSMSVAFVGNSRRLLTGDEAFERADDEVGIFEVVDVDVDVVDLPDAPESASESAPESTSEPDSASASRRDDDDEPAVADAPAARESERGGPADGPAAERGADDESGTGPSVGAGAPDADDAADESPAGTVADDSPEAADPVPRADAGDDSDPHPATDADDVDRPQAATDADDDAASAADGSDEAGEADEADERVPGDDDVFSEEEEWREARAIPSLDPARTEEEGESEAGGAAGHERGDAGPEPSPRNANANPSGNGNGDANGDARSGRRKRPPSPPQSVSRSGPRSASPSAESESGSGSESESRSNASSPPEAARAATAGTRAEAADADDLRERLAAAAAARERLEAERDELAEERDAYREEAARLESRVEELEAEIDELESRLAEASSGAEPESPDRSMSAAEALAGTNLFVRYESKADPTLEDAHGGGARRDEVNDNLRVEHHTQFDTDGLRVEGRPFEEFLRDTVEYRFVDWVVRDLLYDVQATRARSELGELYDVIPRIDRVEIGGAVSVPVGERGDGGEGDGDGEAAAGGETSFDVVLWDGRGNPLLVADLNASRDPATESMVTSLIDDASAVGETHDTLGAAFYVTTSYFEPGALDAVGDATGGGLLSRNKRESFVKLARKQGYHLCLVEARNREFHVSVPDL